MGNKVTHISSVKDLRGVIPQKALLQTAHITINERLQPYLDRYSQTQGTYNIVLGARRGALTAEVYSLLNFVLEIGRDRKNKCAVAAGDIKTYHDMVRYSTLLAGLLERGVPRDLANAAVRLHRAPRVEFAVRTATSRTIRRSRGLLTGASSAGALARIPVEDCVIRALDKWRAHEWGFQLKSSKIFAVIWSDNVFTIGDSQKHALRMFEHLESPTRKWPID